jgi:hypothetical protein
MTLPAGYELQSEFAQRHRAEGRTEGRVEGRAEGRAEGRTEERSALLKRLLSKRFGDLPAWAERRIETASPDQTDAWVDAVLTGSSLAEILGPE